MKYCKQCQKEMPSYLASTAVYCGPQCRIDFNSARSSGKRTERRKVARADKVCLQCGMKFTPRNSSGRYCGSQCVKKANYDPKRARELELIRRYGITSEEFDVMLEAQGGVCAICGTTDWPGKGNRPHADHCHVSNKFRGVLCHDCNVGLGNFKDDIARLEAAIEYLKRN